MAFRLHEASLQLFYLVWSTFSRTCIILGSIEKVLLDIWLPGHPWYTFLGSTHWVEAECQAARAPPGLLAPHLTTWIPAATACGKETLRIVPIRATAAHLQLLPHWPHFTDGQTEAGDCGAQPRSHNPVEGRTGLETQVWLMP